MVKGKMLKRKGLCLLLCLIVLGTAGCAGAGNPSAPEESSGAENPENAPEEDPQESAPEDEGEKMHAPQAPPDGVPYDEWKKIEYTKETAFDCRSFWEIALYDGSVSEENGYTKDPAWSEGHLEITDAKAEPVGGEMKLRSGGYVDITVTYVWTGKLRYLYDPSSRGYLSSIIFQSNGLLPFDAYTGTSLFNYSQGEDAQGIHQGEATDSGLVESDVTWNGRIYRLFAGEDHRNAGGSGMDSETSSGGKEIYTRQVQTETVWTFRVPADYDGLALLLDADIFDEKEYEIAPDGEILSSTDLYADVLTDNRGKMHDPEEFIFLKVSDLLEAFEEQ